MSGRDLRTFITHHRIDESEKLAIQAKTGILASKIKPVDYESLKAFAAEKRLAGCQAMVRFRKLQNLSKFRKEQNAIKQHKAIWFKELTRLNLAAKRIEIDSDVFMNEITLDVSVGPIFTDLETYERNLSIDFIRFKGKTLDPILDLRDDLKLWLQKAFPAESSVSVSHGNDSFLFSQPEQVKDAVDSVKQQQELLLENLSAEQHRLEEELHITGICDASLLPDRHVETGIPEEAFELECPDLLLKTSVLEEFILVDGKYVEKLTDLEQQHSIVLNLKSGGWSEKDHSLFVYINDQYTFDVQNRRLLFFDCLMKHLPHKSRIDLVEHENWWMRCHFYYQRCRDLMSDWLRDRTELLNRAKVVFSEACQAKELQDKRQESFQKQREFCEALYTKVCEWREKKIEVMKLEEEEADRRKQELEAAITSDQEEQKIKRQKQKEKIREFHEQLQKQEKFKEEEERRHLEELQKHLAEQAFYDKERVKFREDELQKKEEMKLKKEMEQLAAKEEKERILEAIRQKVRPHVQCDLLRLWSDTIAWQARQKPDTDVCLLKPLFDVKTFTSEQIASDPRFRLEECLRQNGLHNSSYARNAMASMRPLRPPRKDLESTIFRTT